MKTIAIELNHVIRNYNKQILKYYKKDFDESLDIKSIDDKQQILGNIVKFESRMQEAQFVLEDYPYELFGCADTMEKNLARDINMLLYNVTNIEDEEYKFIVFGLGEQALTIQSSYFFLSKHGLRFRKTLFPESYDELFNECDVVVTANKRLIENIPSDKKVVIINRPFNNDAEKSEKTVAGSYDTLTEFIEDFENARKNF